MSAINQNHLYGGAVYKGHNLNGVMPFNQLLFTHSTRITVKYIDVTNNNVIFTKSFNLEYNRDDNMKIFHLPFIQNNDSLNYFTDQRMKADFSRVPNPNVKLGIHNITSYNNREVIDYYIAPAKITGDIYVNYIYNQQILKQDKWTGEVGTICANNLSFPTGYQAITGQVNIIGVIYQYQPQYENVLLEKVGD